MTYDVQAAGALCAQCPLQKYRTGPVPPEINPGAIISVVGQSPGKHEVEEGYPFAGGSGNYQTHVMERFRFSREDASYHNVIACRPVDDNDQEDEDMEVFLRKLAKENPESPSPIECCRPRLLNELKDAKALLLYGRVALQQIANLDGITKYAGHPLRITIPGTTRQVWAVPALHPAAVLRERRNGTLFEAHVEKALRIAAEGQPNWVDGKILIDPSPAEFIRWLRARGRYLAIDYETVGLDFWRCPLRCVGFTELIDGGHADQTCVFALTRDSGRELAHPREALEAAVQCMREELPKRVLIAHNRKVEATCSERLGIKLTLANWQDTMEGHHCGWPELRHGLSVVASQHTDSPYWKDDVSWTDTNDGYELYYYNAQDNLNTARSAPHVFRDVARLGNQTAYKVDLALSDVYRKMTRIGVRVDHERRKELGSQLYEKFHAALEKLKEVSGCADVNPFSPQQIGRWLYEEKGYSPQEHTDQGAPSTNRVALLKLVEQGVDRQTAEFIDYTFECRDLGKTLGTYCGYHLPHLRELYELEQEEPEKLNIGPDGRCHPTWNGHVTPTGRAACSDPGLHQQPSIVRGMFVPEPGNVICGIDGEQMELRIIAVIAGVHKYKEVFAAKQDIHTYNTEMLIGITPKMVDDKFNAEFPEFISGQPPATPPKEFIEVWPKLLSGEVTPEQLLRQAAKAYFKKMRVIGKSCNHGLNYGATKEKLYEMVRFNPRIAPDVRARIDRRMTDLAADNWAAVYPEIPAYQEACYQFWLDHGYVETPWHKRRRQFANGRKDRNAMGNHPAQGGAADLINEAKLRLVQMIPFDYDRKHGLIIESHDALFVEVAEEDGERANKILEEVMYRRFDFSYSPSVEIFGKAEIGRTWLEACG